MITRFPEHRFKQTLLLLFATAFLIPIEGADGKVARKRGPIIDDIAALLSQNPPRLILTIKGRKLSKTASFRIDGVDVELGKHGYSNLANLADADEQSTAPDFFKVLKLEINRPEENQAISWVKPALHKFLITNPDGQNSECRGRCQHGAKRAIRKWSSGRLVKR